jgi:hypothetical protein
VKHRITTGAGVVATFVVWAMAAVVMRFGHLVTGPGWVEFNWLLAVALLFTSHRTGPWLATRIGIPGYWTDEMVKAKVDEHERSSALGVRTVRPLGALGCLGVVLALGLIAGCAWWYLQAR